MKAIIGQKVGMTQIIADDGQVTPVTIIKAGPCTVTQIKTLETDGYTAVQLGYGVAKRRSKAIQGHVKKANILPIFMSEFRVEEQELSVGSSFDVSTFESGDTVKVTGTSKGQGWAGTVKRWNFNTSKKSHGGKGTIRRPGSIGSMYPQKVFKGKKMAGRMGGEQVTVRGLKVALVDKDKNLLGIVGAVPGPKKSIVTVEGM